MHITAIIELESRYELNHHYFHYHQQHEPPPNYDQVSPGTP
jgi:hypothetical protein